MKTRVSVNRQNIVAAVRNALDVGQEDGEAVANELMEPDPLQIDKTLVISTAHLWLEDRNALEAAAADARSPINVVDVEYGYILWVDQKEYTEELPLSVIPAMELASRCGCQWLRYDCDAKTTNRLPTYEW